MTSAAASVVGVAAGEVDHGRRPPVGPTVDEVAAVGDLVRRGAAARATPPRSAPGRCGARRGRSRGCDMLPTSLPGGSPVGDDRRPTDLAPRGQRPGAPGMSATSSGVRPPELVDAARRHSRRARRPRTSWRDSLARPRSDRSRIAVPWPTIRPCGQRARDADQSPARRRGRRRACSKRSGRSNRSARCSGSGGRTPVAASTASGNLAGWAVARHTIGTSRVARRAASATPTPTAVCGSISTPVRSVHVADDLRGGLVVDPTAVELGAQPLEHGDLDGRPVPVARNAAISSATAHRRGRAARTAGARGSTTPGCPSTG